MFIYVENKITQPYAKRFGEVSVANNKIVNKNICHFFGNSNEKMFLTYSIDKKIIHVNKNTIPLPKLQ